MLIGIDANEANVKNKLGIGQYAFNILLNLHKLDKKNKYIVYLKDQPRSDLPKPKLNWQYKVFGPSKLWTRLALPLNLFLSSPKPDIFLSLGHYTPCISPCPTIPFIMDLGYLKYPDQFTGKDLYQLTNWTRQSIKKAPIVFTISQFSKQEIEHTYNIRPDIIVVAPPASDPLKTTPAQDKQVLQKYAITKPYFLYLGTLKPNKNIPFLLNSFSQFLKIKPDYQLVIAGKKGWLFDDIFSTVKKLKIDKQVIFTDFFEETEKWSLYKQAQALIIPSLYEGFGMPALEAMSVGTPAIGSNLASIPEVIGKAGILIDPTKVDDLVNAMQKISQSKIRQKLSKLNLSQAKNFSWQSSAQIIIRSIEKLLN